MQNRNTIDSKDCFLRYDNLHFYFHKKSIVIKFSLVFWLLVLSGSQRALSILFLGLGADRLTHFSLDFCLSNLGLLLIFDFQGKFSQKLIANHIRPIKCHHSFALLLLFNFFISLFIFTMDDIFNLNLFFDLWLFDHLSPKGVTN